MFFFLIWKTKEQNEKIRRGRFFFFFHDLQVKPLFEPVKEHEIPSIRQRVRTLIKNNFPTTPTLYHMLYLSMSILGIPLYCFPYAFHVLHFARRSEVLGRVFSAIASARQQLGWVALLLLFIMYNYTLLSFAYLRRSFHYEDGTCDALLHLPFYP